MNWLEHRTFDSRALELVAIGFLLVWTAFLISAIGYAGWWVWQVSA
jgi:hypothetical protein